MLIGMNEDGYVGKIQKKRRVFFLGKGNFQKKEKKDLPEDMDGGLEGWREVRELRREERVKKREASFSGR